MIIVVDSIFLVCKGTLDKPGALDQEAATRFVIGVDIWDDLWLPAVLVFPFVWLVVLVQARLNLQWLPYVFTTLLALVSVSVILLFRFRRYYFRDDGMIVLDLVAGVKTFIPTSEMLRYTSVPARRGQSGYVIYTQHRAVFMRRKLIRDEDQFHAYFKRLGGPYYIYESFTGLEKKSDS